MMKHFSTKKTIALCLVNAIAVAAMACNEAAFQSDETQFKIFEQSIARDDFDGAMRYLDVVLPNAKNLEDEQTIEYNKAATEILSGKCDAAVTRMKALIDKAKEHHSTQFVQFPLLFDKMPNDIHMGAHYLIATGLLCPTRPFPPPSKDHIEEAIQHLIHLIQYGEDHRDLLSLTYSMLFTPCQAFVSPNEPQNNSYETALSLAGLRGIVDEFTLCPNTSRWFLFKARQHEILSLFIKLRSLDRKFWIDDSSQLPYSQIQIALYKAPKNGEKIGSPIETFAMPEPTDIPAPNDFVFLRQQLNIPLFEVEEAGDYLVQFYTKDNGEARVTPVFNKWINCAYNDDETTYTEDLVQIPIKLEQGRVFPHQMICPSRPDLYKIELEPHQSVIVSLRSTNAKLIENSLHIDIKDKSGRSFLANWPNDSAIDPHKIDPHSSTKIIPYFDIFKGTFRRSLAFEEYFYTLHILIENDLNTPNTISIALDASKESEGIQHSIAIGKSLPCSHTPHNRIVERTLPVDKLNDDDVYFAPPEWLCPNDAVRYKPTIPANKKLFNATLTTSVLSHQAIAKDDFSFDAYITLPPDNQPFTAELSTQKISDTWRGPHEILDYTLQKPMMKHTFIELEMQPRAQGFAFMMLTPPTNNDDEKESQEQQDKNDEKQQQDPNKRDKNPSKDENTPKPDPEKPSETPQTPKGQGDDAQGNESTPSPDDGDGKAHQFDPAQAERDYVDTLLDNIEQGQLEMPIQGQTYEKMPKKDW